MNSISFLLVNRDSTFELERSLNSIHENYLHLRGLGLDKALKGIVILDYASHPLDADRLLKVMEREKSTGWTQFIFERRVISLTPAFPFERALQLQTKLESKNDRADGGDWIFFLKPGLQLDPHFLRKFLINPPVSLEHKKTKKNPLGIRLNGEFVVPRRVVDGQGLPQQISATRMIFPKWIRQSLLGEGANHEFVIFERKDLKFLSLDWYARYPKYTFKDVVRDAVKSRGWELIRRDDLTYRPSSHLTSSLSSTT